HADQAGGLRAHVTGIEAQAVVLDLHHAAADVGNEADTDLRRFGVLGGVVEALLQDAEQRDRPLLGKSGIVVWQLELQLPAGALRGLLRQLARRRGETEVRQRGRAEILDDAALHLYTHVEVARSPLELLGEGALSRGALAAGPRAVHLDGGEGRPQRVVQLAAETRLLGLAHFVEIAGEIGKLHRALAHLLVQPLFAVPPAQPVFLYPA